MRERREARVFSFFLSFVDDDDDDVDVDVLSAHSQPLFWSSLSISTRLRLCIVISASLRAGTEAEKRRERAGTRVKEAA